MLAATSQPKLIDFQHHSAFRWTVQSAVFFKPAPVSTAASSVFFALASAPAGWMLSPAYYVQAMGWTCQQEWKMEKTTKLALRIRLGSQDQADWLDGKRQSFNGW